MPWNEWRKDSKAKPYSQHENRATEPSQLQLDTQREVLAHQSAGWARAQNKTTRGGGKADRTETETPTQEGRQQRNQQGPHKHSEERKTKTERRRGKTAGAQRQHNPTPHRATQAKKHKTAKENESSTDKASEEQSALYRSQARSEKKTDEGEGRAAGQDKKQQDELEQYECTCHVYGQTHKYREKLSPKHTLGRIGHQCTCHVYGQMRQWKRGPKWTKRVRLTGHAGTKVRSRPGQKGPTQLIRGAKRETKMKRRRSGARGATQEQVFFFRPTPYGFRQVVQCDPGVEEWNDSLRADKHHHVEYTTRSQTYPFCLASS